MNKILKLSFIVLAIIASAASASAINPLNALKGVVNSITSTDKFEVSALQGTWVYESPAVTFKSDNALNKVGGAAASSAIEGKIAPYYNRLGLDTAVFDFDAEGNFTLTIKGVKLSGVVTKDDDQGKLTFNFKASGKIKLGKVSANATKSATGELTLTFDASRVISVVDKIASFAKNSTLTTLSNLLNTYDGLYAGARFQKAKDQSQTTTQPK